MGSVQKKTKTLSKAELKSLLKEQMLNEDLSLDLQPFLRMLLEASEGITEVANRSGNRWIGMLAKFVSGTTSKVNKAVDNYFAKQQRQAGIVAEKSRRGRK